MCVCVCFGSKCLTFFLLKDDFKSLKCCLDIWLSRMFDCIYVCVFLFFEKLFLSNLDRFSTPLDRLLSIKPSFFLSRQKLIQFQSIKLSGFCLDSFSTNSQSIKKLSICSIAVQSIKVSLCSIASRQLLDLSRSSCMHCFSHVLHFSFILSSITSCFITFMYFYGFLLPP